MDAPTFDLQSHSTCSDGALEPAAVVAAAAAAGVTLLALTDHDTVDGIDEALAAAAEHGIDFVPAVELSTVDDLGEDFHVLGYRIDHHDEALAECLEKLARRSRRIASSAWRPCSATSAWNPTARSSTRAAPRAARSGARTSRRPRSPRTASASSPPGSPSRRRSSRPTSSPAARPTAAARRRPCPRPIDAIHAAGGLAVWAHPFFDLWQPSEVGAALTRFKAAGLDGVEAFYATHDREQTLMLARTAGELDLLTTGSADFHSPTHRHFSRFRAFDLYGLEPNLGPIAPQNERPMAP